MNHPEDVTSWRTDQRERLLSRRSAIAPKDRIAWNKRITRHLLEGFPCLEAMIIGFCWPFKGEFDARFAIRHFRERGALAALPVVVAQGRPLEFRVWFPEAGMSTGVLGLPVPRRTPLVRPDAVLIPPVGFGSRGYRLGYGGGYFDRTLASLTPQPLKIGVAFEVSRIETIYPQPHDVPMDFIVTEAGVHEVGASGLTLVSEPARLRAAVARLSLERSRPKPGPWAEPDGRSLTTAQTVKLMNRLLEADRATVSLLAAYLRECDIGSIGWLELSAIHRIQSGCCAKLVEIVSRLGGTPSGSLAGFHAKGLALADPVERLQFLSRGQQWSVQRIRSMMPKISDGTVASAVKQILIGYVRNLERYDRLLRR